ncbi:hypothetical protein [Polyangium sp. y55x31]|uniref:hypothetical protein n=1 Tax=Polyangium sp. y55x31 TaxID=3042688 RepID=UPI0024829F20|nr:hypothetical protein [Polyangium sp. y55x31]MDI1481345.1 hypothetical protein [Polyangium sp. y55x31]
MSRVRLQASILVGALVTACTSSSPPARTSAAANAAASTDTPAPAADTPSTTSIIELQNLVISEDGLILARLRADGRTQYRLYGESDEEIWIPGPTLKADGTILFRGGVTARVQPDGCIYIVNPPGHTPAEHLFGRISGDTLVLANPADEVRVDGNMLHLPNRHIPSQIHGMVDARSRHTALVMAAAFYINTGIVPE